MKNPFKKNNPLNYELTTVGAVNAFVATLRRQFGRASSLFGYSPDGKRNYNELFGYGEQLSFSDYYSMYLRGGIAHAVVDKVAKSCWRDVPELHVDEEPVLEDEIDMLKRAGFFRAMERADILNRIGNFSVLLIGAPDGLELNQPLGKAANIENYYFNPYGYDGIEINSWDQDPASPRYGKPELYSLTVRTSPDQNKQVQQTTVVVHYTRIVHMAEGALDSTIEGNSSLQPVWNILIDILKTRGGGAEAYFRNARQKFALEADKDAKIDKSTGGLDVLKSDVEAFTNNHQDFMRMQGMSAKVFQPEVASPRDQFDIEIEEIAGVTGIPIRVLTGKGAGQLAGAEDRASWNNLVDDRQNSECSGYLEQGLAIFAEAGLIELPDNYVIVWPVSPTLNETEAGKVTLQLSSALHQLAAAASTPGGSEIDMESALLAVGLGDVEIDDTDIDDTDIDEGEDDE